MYTRWGKKTCPSGAELVLSGKFDYLDAIHIRNPKQVILRKLIQIEKKIIKMPLRKKGT